MEYTVRRPDHYRLTTDTQFRVLSKPFPKQRTESLAAQIEKEPELHPVAVW